MSTTLKKRENILIKGGKPLSGTVEISCAKNSVLKLVAAALLGSGKSKILNVPDIEDVRIMIELLKRLGCGIQYKKDKTILITPEVKVFEAKYDLVSLMRASIVVLGPLVAKYGFARVALPGGCNIGRRKIDLHLKGLKALGADVSTEKGFIEARANKLKGAEINLHFPSVGATENIIMAAVLAKGETLIENAAREPEIVDLCKMLRKMGASIEGEGTATIRIEGTDRLSGVEYNPIPDRIEAGTYILAGLITNGRVKVKNVIVKHLEFLISKLREAGAKITTKKDSVTVYPGERLTGIDVATFPYPGFPTDLQAQIMSVLSKANGISVITENVFENRFLHADELIRMGANVDIQGKHAIIKGVDKLTGVPVRAMDLRGGAALCVAGLAAEGKTVIYNSYHIYRGYEDFIKKLNLLNADVGTIEVK